MLLITDPDYTISARVLGTTSEDDEEATDTTPLDTTPVASGPTIDTGPIAPGTGDDIVTESTTAQETTSTLAAVVRETGTLDGQGPNRPLLLRFTDITSSITSVRVGADVDTSGGTNSLAPQGIPIGRITAVIEQQGTSSALVEVTPYSDLRRLSFITVVLFLPNEQAVLR